MIVFHAKRDGTVTTEPSFVPQGSALADLVVISEHDYAFCTIRLMPPSGKYIPDIVCNFVIKSDDTMVWTAQLPASATEVSGMVDYQLIFSAQDGTTAGTLRGAFNVPAGVITNMPNSVGDLEQMTVNELYALLGNILAVYRGLAGESSPEVTIGSAQITASSFTNGVAPVVVTGLRQNSVAFIMPSDISTKQAAEAARLSINPVPTLAQENAIISVSVGNEEALGNNALNFVTVVLRGSTAIEPKVYLVGLNSVVQEEKEADSISIQTASISPNEWTDSSPLIASISVEGIGELGTVAFIFPADDSTRIAAAAARLHASPYPFSGIPPFVEIIRAEVETIPTTTLNFIIATMKDESSPTLTPRVVLVGIDAYGEVSNDNSLTSQKINEAISSALVPYITASKADEKYQPKGDYATEADLKNAITMKHVNILPSAWTDFDPYQASVFIDELESTSSAVLLFPNDEATKNAAAKSKISVYTDVFTSVGGSVVNILRAETQEAPTVALNFLALIIKDDVPVPTRVSKAVLVGVDSSGLSREEIKSMIYETVMEVIADGSY